MASQAPPLPLPIPTFSIQSAPYTTPSSRWRALTTRDPASSTSFIYGVISTGIYCRPTCSARLARRANVTFFDTGSAAASAGFRPCKRCRPDVKGQWDPARDMVERACKVVREKRTKGETVSLDDVAASVGVTRSHFCRVFKKVVGKSLGEWERKDRAVEDEKNKEREDMGDEAASDGTPSTDDGPDVATPRSDSGLDWDAFLDFEAIEKGIPDGRDDVEDDAVIVNVFERNDLDIEGCQSSSEY